MEPNEVEVLWVYWESRAAFILLECLCPCMSPNHTVITSFGENTLGKIADKKQNWYSLKFTVQSPK